MFELPRNGEKTWNFSNQRKLGRKLFNSKLNDKIQYLYVFRISVGEKFQLLSEFHNQSTKFHLNNYSKK